MATGGQMWHPTTTYCVEMMFNANFSEPRLVAGVCFQDVDTDDSPILYTAYAVGKEPSYYVAYWMADIF